MGQQALSAYLPENQKALAITLGRLPGWIQIAFVERMKRTMTPVLSLFLSELGETTAHKDVAEEIRSIKR